MTRSDAGAGLPQDMCFTVRPPCVWSCWYDTEASASTPRQVEITAVSMEKKFENDGFGNPKTPAITGSQQEPEGSREMNPQPNPQVNVQVLRLTLTESDLSRPSPRINGTAAKNRSSAMDAVERDPATSMVQRFKIFPLVNGPAAEKKGVRLSEPRPTTWWPLPNRTTATIRCHKVAGSSLNR